MQIDEHVDFLRADQVRRFPVIELANGVEVIKRVANTFAEWCAVLAAPAEGMNLNFVSIVPLEQFDRQQRNRMHT